MNAGSIHRVGPNRSFVRMARRFADLGYPVLRMDLSGIGDSPAPAGCVENLPYPRDAILDAQAAMTALAEQRSELLLCGGDLQRGEIKQPEDVERCKGEVRERARQSIGECGAVVEQLLAAVDVEAANAATK